MGTNVNRDKIGKLRLSIGLSGQRYEDYVADSKARLEIAEHNKKVLRTKATRRNAAKASKAFRDRVNKYTKKYFKSKKKYLDRAKGSKIEVE